jgi:hypothetical protein
MPTHQLGHASAPGYVDKRRLRQDDFESRVVSGPVVFTANGAGTTTTIVGANAAPATPTNVIRIGEEVKLFNASGLKEETVFRVTAVAVAGTTTVTFTPAAAVATASGDTLRLVGTSGTYSHAERDRRLVELGFSAAVVAKMTENDKMYQLRVSDDPGSLP